MKAGIAGGGILGQLLAFSLINAGWNVTIFDQANKANCSMAAAGLLSPIAELDKNDLAIFHLGQAAIQQHWPMILKKLNHKVYYRRLGSLVISHPNDASELKRYIQMIVNKLGNNSFYQYLNDHAISQLEPELVKFSNGYYFPDEAQIDNQMLLQLLEKYLITNGVAWLKNIMVLNVIPEKIILNNKTYQFDMVFDCRGLGATHTFKDLRSMRGELVWLQATDVFIARPVRFLHPRYSLYLVPRPNQTYLVGASEIESHDDSNISVKTILELLTSVYFVNAKFGEARVIKTVTQCRPVLKNHLPKIKYCSGFVAVNGLYRHGFLIAPTIVHDIMQWINVNKIENNAELWEKYA